MIIFNMLVNVPKKKNIPFLEKTLSGILKKCYFAPLI